MTVNTFNARTLASITKVALVLACMTAAFVVPVPGAEAASTRVRECTTTGDVAFSPRLTTTFVASGTLTYEYDAFCVVEYTNGATGTENYSASSSYVYTGSCVSASVVSPLDPATTRALVGGTTLASVRHGLPGGLTFVGTLTLVSSTRNPCDMPTAITAGASTDVTPGSIP